MSFQLMAWASEQTTGSPTRKAVLMALANRANSDTGRCHPSVAKIAAETELSDRAVRDALKALDEAGFIVRDRQRRTDGSLSTYSYSFPHLPAADADLPAGDAASPPAGDAGQNLEVDLEPGREPGELAAAIAAGIYDPRKGEKMNGRNLPWDALVEVTQADEKVEAGRIAAALKKIRSFVVDGFGEVNFEHSGTTPYGWETYIASEIHARATLYRGRWPNVELTPTALAANWARVTTAPPGGSPESAVEAAQRGIDHARRTA